MNSFLKKLGQVLAKGIAIAADVAGLFPLVQPFLGSSATASKAGQIVQTATNDLTSIGQTVVTAEALIQAPNSGSQKLAAAAPLVEQILKTSELVSGKHIANEAAFSAAAQKITSGVADLLNSLDQNAVKTA